MHQTFTEIFWCKKDFSQYFNGMVELKFIYNFHTSLLKYLDESSWTVIFTIIVIFVLCLVCLIYSVAMYVFAKCVYCSTAWKNGFAEYCEFDQLVLCNTIDTTRYCHTKVVVLTSKFGIVGIDYAI